MLDRQREGEGWRNRKSQTHRHLNRKGKQNSEEEKIKKGK